MGETKADLLNELRIGGADRDSIESTAARWPWIVAALALLALLAAAAGWWYLGSRPLPVRTAAALAPGSAAPAALLQATGYITARRQATVSAQMTGTLTQVLIEEGDQVRQGQVIARLEDTGLRAALAVAQANLLSSQAQVAQAQATLAQAQADARRQDELAASGMATRQGAEQARTAVATAAATLDARRREVDAARAQVTQSQVNFDYTVVRAPFSGVVTVKAAQVGEIISPLSAGGGFTRTGVGTIVDMDSLEIDVDVSETYIGQVKPGMAAEAVLSAYPDWRIPAHVIAIVPSADRGKATVKVRVGLGQKDARIVPDMGVRVSFLAAAAPASKEPPKGVLIPPEAIATRGGASVVFVVEDGHARQRGVTPGSDYGSMKLIPAGLKAGDAVVLAPPAALADGAAVTTAAPDAH
ncbi:MAG: efflux RND transporter periplasmic adaptor subunit [Burkholderiales bacterium]|nr:efflux RND transporter periplasmic adaptor subunit [Burkholderiales bacterium]